MSQASERDKEWIIKGFEQNKIFCYPDFLFDYLRPYSYGGLPVPILLHIIEYTNGKCYERALLMQLAFDDCKVVHAGIESLRQQGYSEEDSEHAYVETNDFSDDTTYVIDTSLGLIVEKEYYDAYQKPKVTRVFSKKECMETPYIQSVLASDFEKDKWALTMIIPFVEDCIQNSNRAGTIVYREKLEEEIEKLKKAINYDAMQEEVNADLKLLRTDPEALDKKYKIVTDKYGRVISRGGEKIPYYTKIGKKDLEPNLDERGKIPLAIPDEKTIKRILKAHEKEYEQTRRLAKKHLIEIEKNPKRDVYDQPGEN